MGKVKSQGGNPSKSSNQQGNSTTKTTPKQALQESFFDKLFQPREPIEYIYEGLIPKGLPGGLFASGGTGKTFFCLQQAIYGAVGLPFGQLKPTRPLRTAFFCAEDEERFLLERAETIIEAEPELKENLELIKENCIIKSLAGQDVAFLGLDQSGIKQSEYFAIFLEELAQYDNLDWIGLDPLVSFWGISENDAESGRELVRCLTIIAKETGASVQVSHHVSKSATRESISTSGGRGSSAIYDGLRWGFGLTKILPTVSTSGGEKKNKELTELRELSGDSKGQFVKMFSAKSSHAPEIASTMIFKRGNKGQLEYFNKANYQAEITQNKIIEFIQEHENISASEICRQPGKALRDDLSISSNKLKALINELLFRDILIEHEVTRNKTTKKILAYNEN